MTAQWSEPLRHTKPESHYPEEVLVQNPHRRAPPDEPMPSLPVTPEHFLKGFSVKGLAQSELA